MTRPPIEELDRLWEGANRKRAFDASNPASGIEEQVSATNRYACAVAVAYPELSVYVKRLEESLKLCRDVLLAISHPCAMGCNEGMRATGHSANCQLKKAIESANEVLGETP